MMLYRNDGSLDKPIGRFCGATAAFSFIDIGIMKRFAACLHYLYVAG